MPMACASLVTKWPPIKRTKVRLANILTALAFARGTVMENFAQVNAKERIQQTERLPRRRLPSVNPSQMCNHTSGCTNKVHRRGLCQK